MNEKQRARLGVIILALALMPGCMNAMLMDTARALPGGESSLTVGIGGSWQPTPVLYYESPTNSNWPGSWKTSRRMEFPNEAYFEQMLRLSYGLGGGGQINLALASPTPAGFGGVVGLKWQLPLPEEHPFAAAVLADGGLSIFGNQSGGTSGTITANHVEAGLILSVDVSKANALYLGPRIRWDTIHHSLTKEGMTASTSETAQSYVLGLGWAIYPPRGGAYYVEPRLIYTPHLHPQQDDGLQVALAIGWAVF